MTFYLTAIQTHSSKATPMRDPRIERLARLLIEHSTRLKPGEKVLIEAFDLPDPQLITNLVEIAAEKGAALPPRPLHRALLAGSRGIISPSS